MTKLDTGVSSKKHASTFLSELAIYLQKDIYQSLVWRLSGDGDSHSQGLKSVKSKGFKKGNYLNT